MQPWLLTFNMLETFIQIHQRVFAFKLEVFIHCGKLHITKKVFGKRSECNSNSMKYFKNYQVWNAIIDQFQNNLTHKNLKTVIFYFFTKLQNSFEVSSWNKQCSNIKLFFNCSLKGVFSPFFLSSISRLSPSFLRGAFFMR